MEVEDKYRSKIKTVDQLQAAIGDFPRKNKVIMCHGTFDVVHPGHLRHLMYAKSKAHILVASITCDAHITKADFRPFVPEDLRAINLAAFDMVDFVVIDRNEVPLKNIERIKPDLFAKGYEYNADGLNPKTDAEKAILENYGGKVLFTPGDIVYSSSKLIESSRPNIGGDKLLALMSAEGIGFDVLHQTLEKLAGTKVHVVGDTIIDSYTDTILIGGQTKTPTLSVRFEGKRRFVGGAGIVAKHMKAAGADVTFSTVLGDDELGEFTRKDMAEADIKFNGIVDATRPTTEKNAIICNEYRLLKVDTLDNKPVADDILSQISSNIGDLASDCVVFSDFRHGIFNAKTTKELISVIPPKAYRVADSQLASRWGNILDFREFDLITPNEREARFALGDQDSVIRPLALRLLQQSKSKNLIMKLGERGIMAYRRTEGQKGELQSFFVLDSFARGVVDAVGSGDALLAYSSLSDYVTKNTVISAVLGAMAAGCECERDGNQPITVQQMHSMIDSVEQSIDYHQDTD